MFDTFMAIYEQLGAAHSRLLPIRLTSAPEQGMATRREAVKVRRGDRDMLFIMASQIISTTHWYDPLSQYFSICKFIYINYMLL